MHFLVGLGCWKNLMILQLICSHVGMSYYMQGDRKQSGKGYCIAFPLVEASNNYYRLRLREVYYCIYKPYHLHLFGDSDTVISF